MKNAFHSVVATSNSLPKLVAAEDLSQRVNMEASRLIELADAGFIPHWRIDGGKPLFVASEARKWIAANLAAYHQGQPLPVSIVLTTDRPLLDVAEVPACLRRITSLEDITDYVCSEAGIYFLCLAGEVVYVGQSKKVAARVQAHMGCKEFDRVLFLRWPVYDLDRVEGAIIRALRPRLNIIQNGATAGMVAAPAPVDDELALKQVFTLVDELQAT